MRSRALVALPALLLVLFASPAKAQSLECREVETLPPWEWAYECKASWLPDGSRITEEQRKTVNAIVLLTVVAPATRRRQ
jgi:hypothetical protein